MSKNPKENAREGGGAIRTVGSRSRNLKHSENPKITTLRVNGLRLARDGSDEGGFVLQLLVPLNSRGALELQRVAVRGAGSRNDVVEGVREFGGGSVGNRGEGKTSLRRKRRR